VPMWSVAAAVVLERQLPPSSFRTSATSSRHGARDPRQQHPGQSSPPLAMAVAGRSTRECRNDLLTDMNQVTESCTGVGSARRHARMPLTIGVLGEFLAMDYSR